MNDDIVAAFLEECREGLDTLERDLVALEGSPDDSELLGSVFRSVHTIKGSCGFLGFSRLESLTHVGEDLLSDLRDRRLVLDADVTSVLLSMSDAIRACIAHIDEHGAESGDDHAELRALLVATRTAIRPVARAAARPVPAAPVSVPVASDGGGQVPSETSVKVDVGILDSLMGLVGELVLVRGRIGELSDDPDHALAAAYRQLYAVTADIQDQVMTARMLPMSTITDRFQRIARDLARSLGKQVEVQVEGAQVGVDRAVIEAIRDPLMHLVRNAIDHGLESVEQRVSAGKNARGTLRIAIHHERGRVQIQVRDDGGGIDSAAVLRKAVQSGLVDPVGAELMADHEAQMLIFHAGLSTKEDVTNVSGRGVGMDVVRARLQEIGGSIDVESVRGEGTTFCLNVPLTLAIVPTLVLWAGGQRLAIPQSAVQEVLLDHPRAGRVVGEMVNGSPFYRLRGDLVPLLDLSRHLELGAQADRDRVLIVVVEEQRARFGLIVDEVGDCVDAVVTPMPWHTRHAPSFSAVTVLGDGHPTLMLDVTELADHLGASARVGEAAVAAVAVSSSAALGEASLVAVGRDGQRLVLPLSDVVRIDQVPSGSVTGATGDLVAPYADRILRLIDTGSGRRPSEGSLTVVVCTTPAGLVGVVVDSVDDVGACATAPPVTDHDGSTWRLVGGSIGSLFPLHSRTPVGSA